MSTKINRDWFKKRLADIGETQASLARFLDVDRSQVSLLLGGRRRFQMDTAEQVARFLKVPIEDVLENAGMKIKRRTEPNPRFRLVGSVDHRMVVRDDKHGAEVEGHPALPIDTVALRFQTASSVLDWMDGWLAFFQPSRSMDPALVTQMCVAECSDGTRRVGNLRRGYASGTYNLVQGGDTVENLEIAAANRILWIKP